MGLKITLKPATDSPPFLAISDHVKVEHIETGIDISNVVQGVTINLMKDEWPTATLLVDVGEIEVEELDLDTFVKWHSEEEAHQLKRNRK